MASVVLDTTVLVDAQRGDLGAVRWLGELPEVPAASEIVRVEFLRGIRSPERTLAERLCATIDWIPVAEPVARLAAEFGREFRRSRQGIGTGDLVVAATASLLQAELATHNVKHFPMFPRLRPPY